MLPKGLCQPLRRSSVNMHIHAYSMDTHTQTCMHIQRYTIMHLQIHLYILVYTHIHFYVCKLKDTLSRHLFSQKILSTYFVLATALHPKEKMKDKILWLPSKSSLSVDEIDIQLITEQDDSGRPAAPSNPASGLRVFPAKVEADLIREDDWEEVAPYATAKWNEIEIIASGAAWLGFGG